VSQRLPNTSLDSIVVAVGANLSPRSEKGIATYGPSSSRI
jgi:hypothetical protein